MGVNTAIIVMAQGIGFSVPANTARWVVSELLTHGRVRRGSLGLAAQQRPLNRQLARFYHLQNNHGVEVVSVNKQGPACKAGIRERDLIVSINSQPDFEYLTLKVNLLRLTNARGLIRVKSKLSGVSKK